MTSSLLSQIEHTKFILWKRSHGHYNYVKDIVNELITNMKLIHSKKIKIVHGKHTCSITFCRIETIHCVAWLNKTMKSKNKQDWEDREKGNGNLL